MSRTQRQTRDSFRTPLGRGSSVTKFTKDHEWVTLDHSGVATIGITNQAQEMLGDIVFVQLPEADEAFDAGDALGSVDSVKTSSDVYAPLTGTVIEANEQLADNPALVNEDARGEAWFVKIQVDEDLSALDELMDEDAYLKMCEEEDHCTLQNSCSRLGCLCFPLLWRAPSYQQNTSSGLSTPSHGQTTPSLLFF